MLLLPWDSLTRVASSLLPAICARLLHRWKRGVFSAAYLQLCIPLALASQGPGLLLCPGPKELHMSWALPLSQFTMGHLSFQRPEVVQVLTAPIHGPFGYQHLCWADGVYLRFHLLSPPCPACCAHGPAFLRPTGFSQLHWQMFSLKGSQCLGYVLH